MNKKEVSDLIEVVLGTLQANLCAEVVQLEAVKDAQGPHRDSAAGAITALRAAINSIRATRESLPK